MYNAAWGKPTPSTVVAGLLLGEGKKKKVFVKESMKTLKCMEKSWVLASLEGQLFLMEKLKMSKRNRWFLEEENLK